MSDFDSTITTKDSTWLALEATKRYYQGDNEERARLMKIWQQHGKDYFTGYKQVLEEILNSKSVDGKFDLKGLESMLHKVDAFNTKQSLKLAQYHIFDDIEKSSFEALSQRVVLRPGVLEFMNKFLVEKNIPTQILSLNWLPGLIRSSLKGFVAPEDVHANTVPAFQDASSQVLRSGEVSNGFEKRRLLRQWAQKSTRSGPVVYVGDSMSDLPALLEADIGFLIGNSQTTLKICKLYGIKVVPAGSIRGAKSLCLAENTLYQVNSWKEIETLLF